MAFEIDFIESYDLDSIVAELQRVAKKLGTRTLTCRDIRAHAWIGTTVLRRKFGSIQRAWEAAGLVPSRRRPSNGEMLSSLADLCRITRKKSGRNAQARELRAYGFPVSLSAILRRFGSWNEALKAAAAASPGQVAKPAPVAAIRAHRPPISDRKRFLVFKRDMYRCQICPRVGGELELGHVIPVCRGGTDKMDNLRTLCRKCSRAKAFSGESGYDGHRQSVQGRI
jgi:HNH endonuclease